jgi:hypothetical protein
MRAVSILVYSVEADAVEPELGTGALISKRVSIGVVDREAMQVVRDKLGEGVWRRSRLSFELPNGQKRQAGLELRAVAVVNRDSECHALVGVINSVANIEAS